MLNVTFAMENLKIMKKKPVRDHDDRIGKFRGACHNKFNINYYTNRYLPVVFHNLRVMILT